LSCAHHILRRGGFVVDVAGVDVSAVRDEQGGNLDSGGRVQRELAVAAAGVDKLRIGGQQFANPVDLAKSRCCVDIHLRPAADQVFRKLAVGGIEDTEASRPPSRARVDVRAGIEKNIDD